MLEFSMKKTLLLVLLFPVLVSLGCSSHRNLKVPKPLEPSALAQALVFQKETLVKGGKVLIVPFSAGENVQAGDQLDHVSLMIVKGIADAVGSRGTPFKILAGQDAQSADFVIRGRILQLEEKKHFSKPWQRKSKSYILQVEGSVLGVDNEEILAKFSQTKTAKSRTDYFETLGYDIGVEIGRFLADSASTKL